jgi:hypothetical protein
MSDQNKIMSLNIYRLNFKGIYAILILNQEFIHVNITFKKKFKVKARVPKLSCYKSCHFASF